MVRAGRTTYFIDVKEAKNGSKYLSICESKINGDEKKKTTIRVFGDSIDEFRRAIDDAATSATE
jgi:hypothetical protein